LGFAFDFPIDLAISFGRIPSVRSRKDVYVAGEMSSLSTLSLHTRQWKINKQIKHPAPKMVVNYKSEPHGRICSLKGMIMMMMNS